MGRTHLLLGLNALWLVDGCFAAAAMLPDVSFPSPLDDPLRLAPCIVAAGLGALLPDLDAPHSLVQGISLLGIRPLVPLSGALYRHLGHRGFLHSLAALALLALLALPLWWIEPWGGGWVWLSLLLGYGSHLLGDAGTKSGVPLFLVPWLHPDRRLVHLLPKPWRLTTGSAAEEALFMLLGATALLLLLRHVPALTAPLP